MKFSIHFILLLLFSLLKLPLAGQEHISIELEAFSDLNVSGRIDLELVQSDASEMQITYQRIDPEKIKTVFENGKLSIKIPPKIKSENAVYIRLPYQSLAKIHAAAGAVINSARDLVEDNIELSASTGGKIELSVQSTKIMARVSQVSDIILYGKASSQSVMVRTGGNYLAYDMVCDSTYITVNGAGQGKVNSRTFLQANANGKGFIGYRGRPEDISLNTSLGGSIITYEEDADK